MPLQKRYIFRARFGFVLFGQSQHFIGHIQTVGETGWPDPPRRKQHVNAAPGAEIKHHFTRFEGGESGRVATAERGQQRRFGNQGRFGRVVQPARNRIAVTAGTSAPARIPTAAGRALPVQDGERRRAVFIAYHVAHIGAVHQVTLRPLDCFRHCSFSCLSSTCRLACH